MNNTISIGCSPEFQEAVQRKLNDWFGGWSRYELLFQWFDNGNAYVCVRTWREESVDIYFLRLWEMNGIIELSQDRKIEI